VNATEYHPHTAFAQQREHRYVERNEHAYCRIDGSRDEASIALLEKKNECDIGKRQGREHEKSPPAPEGQAQRKPTRQYQIRPVNLESGQVIGKVRVYREQKRDAPQPERHAEITQHCSDRGEGREFLNYKSFGTYQIHHISTPMDTRRCGCIDVTVFH